MFPEDLLFKGEMAIVVRCDMTLNSYPTTAWINFQGWNLYSTHFKDSSCRITMAQPKLDGAGHCRVFASLAARYGLVYGASPGYGWTTPGRVLAQSALAIVRSSQLVTNKRSLLERRLNVPAKWA